MRRSSRTGPRCFYEHSPKVGGSLPCRMPGNLQIASVSRKCRPARWSQHALHRRRWGRRPHPRVAFASRGRAGIDPGLIDTEPASSQDQSQRPEWPLGKF